jgi:hypothetical protein
LLKAIRAYIFFACLPALPAIAASITGFGGLSVSVDPGGGYQITVPDPNWHFAGNIGAALSNLAVNTGSDGAGNYSEIGFDFQTDAARHGSIRSYGNRPVVLFSVTNAAAAPNTFSFPNLSDFPKGLNHLTFQGIFAPPTFQDFAADSPWVFFDGSANAFILSPVNHFMTASTSWGPNGQLASGVNSQIATLPAGCQHRTMLVIEKGINRTFDTWGETLTAIHGKKRPANDADASLKQVGYWTDNGASYYYHKEDALTYEQTLAGVKADFDRAGIGLGYIQLDSWFYPKGPDAQWNSGGGGIYQYLAAPALFPDSLSSFQQALGIPLITHARWIDTASPYRKLYKMSGNVVLDNSYWNTIASYLAASGVATYEQDWLDDKAHTDFNLNDGEAFLANMADAMGSQKLTVQYCMAAARHFLESARHGNVTTARTSQDRLVRDRWMEFLYTSRLATAVGLFPFTDNFMSSETSNLLLATLSAGPVGLGDPIGGLQPANLLRTVRKDGVIVKPDRPLLPVDRSYMAVAAGADIPQVAATYSDFAGLRTYYVLSFSQGANNQTTFVPADFELDSPVYLYDYFRGAGTVVGPADQATQPITGDAVYWIAAPVGPSGMAMLGDLSQFVPMGKKRIPTFVDDGTIKMTVAFANGESDRTITGYAPYRPVVRATRGTIGSIKYSASTQRFQIQVMPGPDGTAAIRLHAPYHAPVSSAPGRTPVQSE